MEDNRETIPDLDLVDQEIEVQLQDDNGTVHIRDGEAYFLFMWKTIFVRIVINSETVRESVYLVANIIRETNRRDCQYGKTAPEINVTAIVRHRLLLKSTFSNWYQLRRIHYSQVIN